MGIKRYQASADTAITNAFKSDLKTRGTGSNAGASDVLPVFSIYAQANSSSLEASRILMQFSTAQISTDRTATTLPASGSVSLFLRMFNCPHEETLPKNFNLYVHPLSRSFQEGSGLDIDNYTDVTRNLDGANWVYASSGTVWTTAGGDFLTGALSQSLTEGTEDLEINITSLVENWILGTIANNGIVVYLSGTQENESRSYYTKKFFSRTSEFFFKRPILEARWNSSTTDDRARFFVSSSLLTSAENLHTVYLYNYYAGALRNIPNVGVGSIFVQAYTSASLGDLITTIPSVVTGGYVSTGIYSASFATSTTSSVIYDRWFSGSTYYYTGSINVLPFSGSDSHLTSRKYINSITNLKSAYSNNETMKLRLFSRKKNWDPNLYTIASNNVQSNVIDNAFYKITRLADNLVVIPYGTGSTNETKLSYDSQGNYFVLDTSLLESNHTYGINFIFYEDVAYEEQNELFKFRVIG